MGSSKFLFCLFLVPRKPQKAGNKFLAFRQIGENSKSKNDLTLDLVKIYEIDTLRDGLAIEALKHILKVRLADWLIDW